MPQSPPAIYANVVNIRLTSKELVLEFGVHFPDKPGQGPPPLSDIQPDARIVLPQTALQGFIQALQQTLIQHQKREAQRQATTQNPPSKVQ